jgi:hypothetical protein
MPSEERVRQALGAFKALLGAFRSTLVTTADEVRAALRTRQSTWDGRVARVRAELGPLAVGRIDADRFATLVANHQEADPAALELLERALATLTELVDKGERLSVVEVPAGGSLYDAVGRALAEIGRGFSAARAVHGVRAGQRRGGDEERSIGPLPFARWTKAERRLVPPLVVAVQGSELRAAALAEFLDGRQKIALVVEGECAPAALVRLVAPGTFVLQSADGSGLDRLVAWEGPGIAALVPESAARFVHDPAAGGPSWERIAITHVPDKVPRRTVGGLSATQQAEELELLRSLAARPAGAEAPAAAPVGAGATAEPADKLAAWLLSRVDLSDLG